MIPGQPKPLKKTPAGAELALQLGKSLKKKFGTIQQPSEMTQITAAKHHTTLVSFFKVCTQDIVYCQKLSDSHNIIIIMYTFLDFKSTFYNSILCT